MTNLEKALKPMRRRMKLQRTIEWGVIGVSIGMGCVLLLRAASFLWPFSAVWLWSAVALGGVPLMCMLISHLWPVSAMDAARQVDDHGLQARTQTALMLKESDTPMAELQRQDTLKSLERVQERQVFPLRAPRAAVIAMAACVALFGLSWFFVNPQQDVLKARAAFQDKMAEQAKLVDDGAVKLDAEDDQTPELRRVLGDLSQELRKAEDPRAALTAVDEAERRIEAMQMAVSKDALNALEKSGLGDVAEALKADDASKAEQLLSQQTQENAANALAAAANAANGAAAKQALSAAAQAVTSGNLAQALSQLNAAASGMSSATLQAAALSQMARVAAARAGAQQAALLGAKMGGQGGKGQNGAGLGIGVGAGSAAGTGSSNKDGGYRQSDGRGSAKGQRPGEMNNENYEAIYDPTRLNREGDTVQSRGKVGEGDITETTAGTGLGSMGDSVPYNQVLADYQETAVQAAQNADLPPYAQKWVQDYFGALAN